MDNTPEVVAFCMQDLELINDLVNKTNIWITSLQTVNIVLIPVSEDKK